MNLINYCFYLILISFLCLNFSGCKESRILLPDDEPLIEEPQADGDSLIEKPRVGEDSLIWTPIKDKVGLLLYGFGYLQGRIFDVYTISCPVPGITYDSEDLFWILNYPDTIGKLPRRVQFSGEITSPYPLLQFDTLQVNIAGATNYYLRLTDLKTL